MKYGDLSAQLGLKIYFFFLVLQLESILSYLWVLPQFKAPLLTLVLVCGNTINV